MARTPRQSQDEDQSQGDPQQPKDIIKVSEGDKWQCQKCYQFGQVWDDIKHHEDCPHFKDIPKFSNRNLTDEDMQSQDIKSV